MLVTGGPGTGKTTTVAKLLALLCADAAEMPRIALTAPTGKAAAHMTRSLHRALSSFKVGSEQVLQHLTVLEGQTVHRLLKLNPAVGYSKFNREQPLPFDIVVADEASMLDLPLLHQLLCAIPEHGRLILLGVENQLPPVGIGAVLPVLAQPTVLTAKEVAQLAEWLPEVFESRASCAEADQALIGLPYSIWSAILAVILLMLGGLALRALWRSRVR